MGEKMGKNNSTGTYVWMAWSYPSQYASDSSLGPRLTIISRDMMSTTGNQMASS